MEKRTNKKMEKVLTAKHGKGGLVEKGWSWFTPISNFWGSELLQSLFQSKKSFKLGIDYCGMVSRFLKAQIILFSRDLKIIDSEYMEIG